MNDPLFLVLALPILLISFLAPFVATRLAMRHDPNAPQAGRRQGNWAVLIVLLLASAFAIYLEFQKLHYFMQPTRQPGVDAALMLYRDALLLPLLWVGGALVARFCAAGPSPTPLTPNL